CSALSLFSVFDLLPAALVSPLSLHDALPILKRDLVGLAQRVQPVDVQRIAARVFAVAAELDEASDDTDVGTLGEQRDLRLEAVRSEEHTSELQSRENLVCRLLLEKKKNL